MQQKRPKKKPPPRYDDIEAGPHQYLYTGPSSGREPLVTSLMLASEAVAGHLFDRGEAPAVAHALPAEDAPKILADRFDRLLGITDQIHAWIREEPGAAALLKALPEAFEDGESLRLLFLQLFPGRAAAPVTKADGKPILSRREVEVLREASGDRSYQEIGERLGIAERTVEKHFEKIYRQLGVRRPLQAVARAVALGYLDLNLLERLGAAAGCTPLDFGMFSCLLTSSHGLERSPEAGALQPLAEFGLLLLILCGRSARLQADRRARPPCRGRICLLDTRGEMIRSFGEDYLHEADSIAIAPPQSAQHGFTPGNLFVANLKSGEQQLNDTEIVEFTPEGAFVGAFTGGRDIRTRLIGAESLAFAADGRLLARTNWLTDAILAFENGGKTVRRWADGCFSQICVAPSGKVYAPQASGIGCIVKVFSPIGELLQTIGGTSGEFQYHGLAVSSQGDVFINRTEHHHGKPHNGTIEVFDPAGEHLNSLRIPGLLNSLLAMDAQDRVYVSCRISRDIKVLSPEGEIERKIDLPDNMTPLSAIPNEGGGLWVSGVLPQ